MYVCHLKNGFHFFHSGHGLRLAHVKHEEMTVCRQSSHLFYTFDANAAKNENNNNFAVVRYAHFFGFGSRYSVKLLPSVTLFCLTK